MTDKTAHFRQNTFLPVDYTLRPDIFTEEEQTALAEWEETSLYHGGVPDGQLDLVEVTFLARDLKFISNQTLAGALKKIKNIYAQRIAENPNTPPGFNYACMEEGACITFDLTADVAGFTDRFNAKYPNEKIGFNPRGEERVDGIVMTHKYGAVLLLPFQEPLEKAEPQFLQPVYDNDALGDYGEMHDASLQASDEVWPEHIKWWGTNWREDEELVRCEQWAYPQFEASYLEDLLSVESRLDRKSLEGARQTLYQIIDDHVTNREEGVAGLARVISHFKNPTRAAMVYATLKYRPKMGEAFFQELLKLDPVMAYKMKAISESTESVGFRWAFLENGGEEAMLSENPLEINECEEKIAPLTLEEVSPPEPLDLRNEINKYFDGYSYLFDLRHDYGMSDYDRDFQKRFKGLLHRIFEEALGTGVTETTFNELRSKMKEYKAEYILGGSRYADLEFWKMYQIAFLSMVVSGNMPKDLAKEEMWLSQSEMVSDRTELSCVSIKEPPELSVLHYLSTQDILETVEETGVRTLEFGIADRHDVNDDGFGNMWRIYRLPGKKINAGNYRIDSTRAVILPDDISRGLADGVAKVADEKITEGYAVNIKRRFSRIASKDEIVLKATDGETKPNEFIFRYYRPSDIGEPLNENTHLKFYSPPKAYLASFDSEGKIEQTFTFDDDEKRLSGVVQGGGSFDLQLNFLFGRGVEHVVLAEQVGAYQDFLDSRDYQGDPIIRVSTLSYSTFGDLFPDLKDLPQSSEAFDLTCEKCLEDFNQFLDRIGQLSNYF